jgi:hypothetical protein
MVNGYVPLDSPDKKRRSVEVSAPTNLVNLFENVGWHRN